MASLKELEDMLVRAMIPGVSRETTALILAEMQRQFPGEKIYVQPPRQSKREAIEIAVKTLPTAVVAERFGVSQSYAYKVMRRGVKRRE
jgi:hypothetical protein